MAWRKESLPNLECKSRIWSVLIELNQARTRALRVLTLVTADTQSNQIEAVIRALLAAQLLVVNLEVLSGTTDLASPAIAAAVSPPARAV
jgi:hypothetical protein